MSRHAACTIVARNYTAQARVLHETFRTENPGIGFSTLLVDGSEEDRDLAGVGTVVLPSDLGIEPATLEQMISVYDVMEFATALKPALLMHLIRSGAHAALYFDPDMMVFNDLGDLFDQAETAGVLLTPHVLDPLPRDGLSLDERSIMLAGIYNLGFIGVGSTGYRFLAWWNDRLRLDAISDPAEALFTDQRWIDWVPSLFPHRILRDPGCNVAYWNLHERTFAEHDGAWSVRGAPLRFFHFSGYDPRSPWLLSKHPGEQPRVLLSERPELRALCARYASALDRHDASAMRAIPYRHARTDAGLHLDLPLRRLIRAVIAGLMRPAEPMPPAFSSPDGFVAWLLRPEFGSPAPALRPADVALWLARTDLQNAFPDVEHTTTGAFTAWVRSDPEASAWIRAIEALAPAALPTASAAPVPAAAWRTVDLTEHGTSAHEQAELVIAALLSTGDFVSDDRAVQNLLVLADSDRPLPIDVRNEVGAFPGERALVLFGTPSSIVRSPALDHPFTVLRVVGERAAAAVRTAVGIPVETAPLFVPAAAPDHDPVQAGSPTTILIDAMTTSPLSRTGAATAIAAAAALREQRPSLRIVVLVGDRRRAETERLLYEAGYPACLELVPGGASPSRRVQLLRGAAALVVLHEEPSAGLVLEDALSMDIPVVATPGSLADPRRDEAVTLVGPGADVADVTAALLLLLPADGLTGPGRPAPSDGGTP